MGLRALHETLAGHAARANRDHALDDVKALAQRVTRRVQQRADALLLVIVQHRPTHAIGAQGIAIPDDGEQPQDDQKQRRRNQLPAQACKKYHVQARRQHQDGGAQIWLLHDEPNRHGQQQHGHTKVQRTQQPLALLEPPCQHQRHGDFQDFAGLDGDAQVQPAARALFGDTKDGNGNQQSHPHGVERHRQRHQPLRRNLGHKKQQRDGNHHVAAVVHETGPVVEAGRVHRDQARAGQQADRQRQRDVEASKQRGKTRDQRRFFKNEGHVRDYPAGLYSVHRFKPCHGWPIFGHARA